MNMNQNEQVLSLMEKAKQSQESGDFNNAYETYREAAQMGSDEAMMAIARLFLHTSFRQENRNDWAKLALTGAPVLPWDMHSATGQNLEGALYWAKKAAEAGNAEGCCLAGNMLCRGIGCQPNPEAGILFLKAARSKGVERAQDLLYIYQPGKISLADSDYTETLAQLDTALKTENADAFRMYYALKKGNERQLAKLGYVLTAAKNRGSLNASLIPTVVSPSGIPNLPAAPKRGNYATFVRFNFDAFTDERPLILFSSDIAPDRLIACLHRAEIVGTAKYRSPAFGWLQEEKSALLLRLDRALPAPAEELKQVVSDFSLLEEEYEPDNIAFFTENGEKEYSVEIACLNGLDVDILFRYTIGGSGDVKRYFAPRLLSLALNEPDENTVSEVDYHG